VPLFYYHPYPIRTGASKPSDAACTRCKQSRGYGYLDALIPDRQPSAYLFTRLHCGISLGV
jgi:uncharacterized protein CbrC (UPF0167 family)